MRVHGAACYMLLLYMLCICDMSHQNVPTYVYDQTLQLQVSNAFRDNLPWQRLPELYTEVCVEHKMYPQLCMDKHATNGCCGTPKVLGKLALH